MKVEEILALENPSDQVTQFKERSTPAPDIKTIRAQYSVSEHSIFDQTKRPDKIVYDENDNPIRIEPVARIGVGMEKLITKRAVSFLFGNDVEYSTASTNQSEIEVLNIIKKILKSNKVRALNRRIGRACIASTEVAEYWYKLNTGTRHNRYGRETAFQIKCAVFSPMEGNDLYPLFDDIGNLISFSREYVVQQADEEHRYFETYTDKLILKYKLGTGKTEWEMIESTTHDIGKIPIIYTTQEETDYSEITALRERLEWLLSHFADINDYHAAPKIFVQGKINKFISKNSAGSILEGETGSQANYLSWDHAPEAVKLEIETLLNLIYTLTQTPDVSFESVKGLNAMSGIALKLMFLDAHLKVEDKKEIFDEYMIRRANLLKTMVGGILPALKPAAENIEIDATITPYMIDATAENIDMLVSATGGKQVLSQLTATKLSRLVDDPEAEFSQIQKEEQQAATFETAGSTV